MDRKELKLDIVLFGITLFICGFMWLILGAIGFNRMGWVGVAVAGIPPLLSGIVLYFLLHRILKDA